ncbi:hypothetical protein J1N35_011063 [Gossypium stocksii]|uniref:Secreted protein n=1 Tax=Gossypium stocksii TaxID=47602 RepID=A0A9D4AD24_9ROSI|nr:hypothetical protein J1N35_011063 [Gossypium stocksii]
MVKRLSTLLTLLKVIPRLFRLLGPTTTLFVAPLDSDTAIAVDLVVMVKGEGEAAMVEVLVVAVDVISVVRWAI